MASSDHQNADDDANAGVLHPSMGRGPRGLGDPDSTYLRTLEVDVCIPAKMREKAKKLCEPYMRAYGECAKREQLMLPFRCREVAEEMRQCLQGWYDKPDFQAEAKKEYLEERAEYRRTGITRKQKAKLEEEFPHT